MTKAIDALVADAAKFDFFQALRLIEQQWPGALERSVAGQGDAMRATIRPHDGLAFPSSDVHSVATNGTNELALVVTFLGLYGVDSPLPTYFGGSASDDDSSALRAFLDIFGHRFYVLLFEGWKKYRVALGNSVEAKADLRRLVCLAGLDASSSNDVETRRLLPLAATLRNEVRNAEGLARLISAFFPSVSVQIAENVPRRVAVSDRPRLGRIGQRITLSDTAFLGAELLDVSGQFRIVLGPVSWEQFEAFHPREPAAKTLAGLVDLYVRDALAYDVELRVSTSELPITRLRCPKNRLGLTTWIGRPPRSEVSEIVGYDESDEDEGTRRARSTRYGRRTIQGPGTEYGHEGSSQTARATR